MGLKKNTEGVDLARNIIRDWPDTTLLGKRPHQIVEAFGISITEADTLLKQERRRRNL